MADRLAGYAMVDNVTVLVHGAEERPFTDARKIEPRLNGGNRTMPRSSKRNRDLAPLPLLVSLRATQRNQHALGHELNIADIRAASSDRRGVANSASTASNSSRMTA